ncbi:MAG: hypothetical protein KBG25_05130 [Paludibacteraceae bacterium]|nr:hypothetical protein [Paludibacteraceae bacterium]
MKRLFKKLRFSLWIGLLLTGCVVSNPKFFSKIEPTTDLSYGYTAENPVTIKNMDLNNSISSSYYYLSRLRTEKGNKLQLIQRFSVENPNYEKPKIALQNRYTGEPLSYGTGRPILDLYILKPENETDTIKIYINPYLKGTVKIPCGLKFEKE